MSNYFKEKKSFTKLFSLSYIFYNEIIRINYYGKFFQNKTSKLLEAKLNLKIIYFNNLKISFIVRFNLLNFN